MNDIHSNASIKRAYHVQRLYQFSQFVCKGWIKLVLCPSIVSTMIGSNIVSVSRSSIKVLWSCL